jgi:carboxylesterase type B
LGDHPFEQIDAVIALIDQGIQGAQAAPPVGSLRWKPPQHVTARSGVREVTAFGTYSKDRSVRRTQSL